MKDDCIQLPAYDPNDTEETFAQKLAQINKERLEREIIPDPEQMAYLKLAVPQRLIEAFQKADRMVDVQMALEVLAPIFRRVLVKVYYQPMEGECTQNTI